MEAIGQKTLETWAANHANHLHRKQVEGAALIEVNNETFNELKFGDWSLTGSSFRWCTFTKCDFTLTHLERSRFFDCLFIACIFDRCNLEGAQFPGNGRFSDTTFTDCDMDDINFSGTSFAECNFHRGSCVRSNFTEARLEPVIFSKTYLGQACFRKAVLHKVIFEDLYASCANFSDAVMLSCDLSGIKNTDIGLNFDWTTFRGNKFSDDFYGALVTAVREIKGSDQLLALSNVYKKKMRLE